MSVELDCHLPSVASSVAEARRAVRAAAERFCDDDTGYELMLITSELATNAIEHAASDIRVRLIVEDGGHLLVLRVEVADDDPRRPHVVHEPAGYTGRGMLLVEKLSSRWGVEASPPGKRVYAEVAC